MFSLPEILPLFDLQELILHEIFVFKKSKRPHFEIHVPLVPDLDLHDLRLCQQIEHH